MTYKVTIEGFENEQQADEFINWFSNSGEQDATYHFEEHGVGKTPVFQSQIDSTTMKVKMVEV